MTYLNTFNEEVDINRFAGLVGNRGIILVQGWGVDVDKQDDRLAFKVIQQKFLEKGIQTQILRAGRFGYDAKRGWAFDVSMNSAGHPNNWIPGSRGYYAISQKSLFLFPKNDYQFLQDSPPQQQLSYLKLFSAVFKRPIKDMNGAPVSSNSDTFEGYSEKFGKIFKESLGV